MLLRGLDMIVGFIVGAALMAWHPPSLTLVQKLLRSPSQGLHEVGDRNAGKPLDAMEGGHDKPRRVFIESSLISAPLNWTWNYLPEDPVDGVGNWLYYGGMGDEEEQLILGLQFPGAMPFRYGGVRSEVSGLKVFKSKNIKLKFLGDNSQIQTRFGTMSIAAFSYRYNSVSKSCLAYLSDHQSADLKFEGFYCGQKDEFPDPNRLVCLINSTKIYDKIYWVEPKGSRTNEPVCKTSLITKKPDLET